MLGTLYLTGQGGLEKDPSEAEHWWRMAAEQGYAAAPYNLGGMYARGLSDRVTREEAIDWLGRAAEQGHAAAARELRALRSPAATTASPGRDEEAASDAG
jgi:hypothetical protein